MNKFRMKGVKVGGASAPRPSAPHSSNLRVHRRTETGVAYFVTKCIRPPKAILGPDDRAVVVEAFRYAAQNRRIILAAFVVMPNHWHALFGLLEGWTLPRLMHSLMSFVGANTCARLAQEDCRWQDGYYETWIRSARQFDYVAHYIVENPVRKQLVERAELWDATSLRTPELVTELWPWEFESEE